MAREMDDEHWGTKPVTDCLLLIVIKLVRQMALASPHHTSRLQAAGKISHKNIKRYKKIFLVLINIKNHTAINIKKGPTRQLMG